MTRRSSEADQLRQVLLAALAKAQFEPDTIESTKHGVRFTRRGVEVEDDGNGGWRPKAG